MQNKQKYTEFPLNNYYCYLIYNGNIYLFKEING